MYRVTVVSRDEILVENLTEPLNSVGMEVVCLSDAMSDQDSDPAAAPDVLIVDYRDQKPLERMPLQDAWNSTPTIGLFEISQLPLIHASIGLEDFMVIPADPLECVSRVEQILWRNGRIAKENTLAAGELLIDLTNYQVFEAGKQLMLTYKEYELLRFFITHSGTVFTREQLLNRVWGYNYYGGSRTVDVHVRRLRSKLEPGTCDYIETVRNVGYRFSPPMH